jgi:hypothetical protein
MYFVVGPVLALLISLKFTQQQQTKHQKEYEALVAKVELLETRCAGTETTILKNVMSTVMPIAKAVNKLNQEVGL